MVKENRASEERGIARPRCPKCGRADRVLPIAYGLPTPEAMERQDVIWGGCVVGDLDPRQHCRRCAVSFDFMRPEYATPEVARRGWVEDDRSRQFR